MREATPRTLHITCPRNGRKLKTAWTFLQHEIAQWKLTLGRFSEAHGENDREVFIYVRTMMKQVIVLLQLRLKYLQRVPWAFANAESQAGATACISQIESKPLDQHDPCTLR